MLRAELIKSCTHEKVAEAAVRSIGDEFCSRVSLLARVSGQSTGAYVADIVGRFAEDAGESDWESLAKAVSGSDMPILCGLRWIVEAAINFDGDRSARTSRDRGRTMVECDR
jgi:hypothetical protein